MNIKGLKNAAGAGLICSLAVRGGGVLLNFALNLTLAWLYGARFSGEYYLAYNFSALAVSAAFMGLNYVIVHKTTPFYTREGEHAKGNMLISASLYLTLSASVLICAGITAFSGFFSGYVFDNGEMRGAIIIAAIMVIPGSACMLVSELLKALKKPNMSIVMSNIAVNALLILLLVAFRGRGVTTVLIFNIFAYIVSVIVIIALNMKLFREHGVALCSPLRTAALCRDNWELVKEFWAENLTLAVISISNVVLSVFDTLVIGAMMTASDVAVYSVANKVTSVGSLILTTVNAIIGCQFAELSFRNDREGLKRVMVRYTRIMLPAGVLYMAAAQLFAWLIPYVFGTEFACGASYARLLSLGQFIMIITGPSAYFLIMTGRARLYQRITVCSAVFSVISNLMLVSRFGVNGAVWSSILTLTFKNVWGFACVLGSEKIKILDFLRINRQRAK